MNLINRHEFTNDDFDYDVVTCLINKDGQQSNVLATMVPRIDSGDWWLEFPVESPFELLAVGGIGISVRVNDATD